MQIHDLNTKALTDPAYVAFDDGTDTYKTEFNDVVANAAAAAVADADLTDNTVAFTSGDAASPTAWTAVDVLTSGLSLKTLFNRISTMVKNVRYIWNKIGTASMGTTATTITGAIAEHESDISTLNSKTNFSIVPVIGTAESIASNATKWLTIPKPTNKTAIAVVGYYLNGGTACSVYSVNLESVGAQIAVRNYYSSALNVTPTAFYLCIN